MTLNSNSHSVSIYMRFRSKYENLNGDRLAYTISGEDLWRNTTLVSANIRFMLIFAGFPGKGASNDSGVVENGNF